MKKFFTLACMALAAMSVNAQETETLPENVYPVKSLTMGDIKWEVKNNLVDGSTRFEGEPIYVVNGQGNAYKNIYVEAFYDTDKGSDIIRPYYTYVYYWIDGTTGVPSYGLYYKFTPKVAGQLKVQIWANKGNRATTVVPASVGTPLVPHTDYTIEGYVNSVTEDTDVPQTNEDGSNKTDENGNVLYVQKIKFNTNDEIKAIHDAFNNPWADKVEADANGNNAKKWDYVIAGGNQHFWGWLTFNVQANETYYIFQASSQIGFAGYEFTPTGGTVESYVAAPSGALAAEFAAVVNAEGVATNVVDGNSVVAFGTTNMAVEAVGSGTPTEVVPEGYTPGGGGQTGIETVKTADVAGGKMYNMAGQEVADGFKGLVIVNGKKVIK